MHTVYKMYLPAKADAWHNKTKNKFQGTDQKPECSGNFEVQVLKILERITKASMLRSSYKKKESGYLWKKNTNFMLTYADLFEWEWCNLSCQMGSIVSDVFSAEAGNTSLSSCWKIKLLL